MFKMIRAALLSAVFSSSFSPVLSFEWEYTSLYEFEESSQYTLKVNTTEEAEFHFLAISTDHADEHGLEEAMELAESDWDELVLHVSSGNTLTLHQDLMLALEIEEEEITSTMNFEFHESQAYAFFFEHSPAEISYGLYDSTGDAFMPTVSEVGDHEHSETTNSDGSVTLTSQTWGLSIAATLVTSCLSLSGLVFFLLLRNNKLKTNFLSYAHAFGSGALLTVSISHLLPESYEFLEEHVGSEELGWKAGTVILSGFLFSLLIHSLFATHEHQVSVPICMDADQGCCPNDNAVDCVEADNKGCCTEEEKSYAHGNHVANSSCVDLDMKMKEASRSSLKMMMKPQKMGPECWNIFLGDLICNFLDGVLIASAFASCGIVSGWTIMAAVAAHEIPQEIADFFILVKAGLSNGQALCFNLASGLGSVMGAVVLLSTVDSLEKHHVGYLLLAGVGSFVFVSASELIPEVLKNANNKRTFMLQILLFILGVIVVTVSLLGHAHCDSGTFGHDHGHESDSETDAHDGHDH